MERGVISALKNSGHQLKIIRMDTKRNSSESFKKKAGLNVKKQIENLLQEKYLIKIKPKDPGLFVVISDEVARRAGIQWRNSFAAIPPLDSAAG